VDYPNFVHPNKVQHKYQEKISIRKLNLPSEVSRVLKLQLTRHSSRVSLENSRVMDNSIWKRTVRRWYRRIDLRRDAPARIYSCCCSGSPIERARRHTVSVDRRRFADHVTCEKEAAAREPISDCRSVTAEHLPISSLFLPLTERTDNSELASFRAAPQQMHASNVHHSTSLSVDCASRE
jgi:hypothetical protein